MRTALISPGLPANESDSTCIPPLQHWLRHLPEGVDVRGWALHYPEQRGPYRWHGRPFTAVACPRSPPRRLLQSLRCVRDVLDAHRQQPFSLLHALWLSDAAVIALLAGRLRQLPVVLTAMGQDVLPSNRYLGPVRRLARGQQVTWIATCTRSAQQLQKPNGAAPVHIVPWGVPVDDSSPTERPIDLVGVGSLTENKEYGFFLDTVRLLVQLMQTTDDEGGPGSPTGRLRRVVLIGDGPQRDHLERQLRGSGLGDLVSMRGHMDNAETIETIGRARVLLHPARFEGYGYVFQEALSRGTAVVSRATGCAPPASTPNWRIVNTPHQAATEVLSLLTGSPPDPAARLSVAAPIAETVAGYARLYTAALAPGDQASP